MGPLLNQEATKLTNRELVPKRTPVKIEAHMRVDGRIYDTHFVRRTTHLLAGFDDRADAAIELDH